MNTLKKLLAVFMLVCMLVTLLPAGSAYASGDTLCTVTINGTTGIFVSITGDTLASTEVKVLTDGDDTVRLVAGDYSYTASQTGYVQKTGTFTVPSDASAYTLVIPVLTAEIKKTFTPRLPEDLTLTVNVKGTGTAVRPSAEGEYSFDPDKQYTYTAEWTGYWTETDVAIDLVESGTIPVTLTETKDVSITGTPRATVAFAGKAETDTARFTKSVTLSDAGAGTVALPEGEYTYTASCDHYTPITTPIDYTVAASGNTLEVNLTAIRYAVVFTDLPEGATLTVKNSAGTPVDAEDVNPSATPPVVANTYKLTHGTCKYTVEKTGYESIVDRTFEVTESTTVTVPALNAVKTVSFYAGSTGTTVPDNNTIIKVSQGGTVVKTLTVSATAGSNQCELPAGDYTYVAGISGKTASDSFTVGDTDVTVNVGLAACTTHTDSDTDGKCDTCFGTIIATVTDGEGETNYLDFTAAYDATGEASAFMTMKADSNVASPSIGKNVTIRGGGFSLGALTVTTICTINNFKATSLSVTGGAPNISSGKVTGSISASGGRPTFNTVEAVGFTASGAAVPSLISCTLTGAMNSNGTGTVSVASGTYNTVRGSGKFSINGGSFKEYVSAAKCLDISHSVQYYAKKYGAADYRVERLVPAVSAVSNDGEFIKSGSTTLAFTTNIPWELASPATNITVKVDGADLATGKYTLASSGGTDPVTLVTLTNAYLKTLTTAKTYTVAIAVANTAAPAASSFRVVTVSGAQVVTPDENGVCSTTNAGATITAAALDTVDTNGTGLSVTTNGGTVAFEASEVTAINTAAGNNDLTLEITKSSDGKTFTITLNNGAIYTFGNGGSATVTLNVGTTCPASISHKKHDGSTEIFYPAGATGTKAGAANAKHFTYSNPNATLELSSFSEITINAVGLDITDRQLPTAVAGAAADAAYGPVTFAATGGTGYKWSMSNATLAAAPYSFTIGETTGILAGTIPGNTPAQTWSIDITATDTANSANTKTETFYLTAVSANTPFELRPAGGGASTFHATFTAAQAAAAAGDSIYIHSAPPAGEDITVSENVKVFGNGYTVDAVTVSSTCTVTDLKAATLTVTAGSPTFTDDTFTGLVSITGGSPTFTNVTAKSDVSSSGSGTVTMDKCVVDGKLTTSGTGTMNLNTCTVKGAISSGSTTTVLNINGGSYNTINTTATGANKLNIKSGTFKQYIYPADCYKEGTSPAVKQYYSYESSPGVWTVTGPLSPAVTAVSNGGYHMRRSSDSIAFTTNIPASLTADVNVVRVGTSNLTLNNTNSRYYSMYSSNGNDTGTIVIALTSTYLNTLSTVGNYTLTIETDEGNAERVFEIGNTVRTGDSANMPLWMGLMGGSVLLLVGAAAFIMVKNKKKKK